MSSAVLTQLVSFLTRPLMRSHSPATIVSLQLSLHNGLSSLLPESSLLLSAKCPAPPVIQRACLLSGVRWAEWIRLLSRGIDLEIFIIESSLDLKLGRMPRKSLWKAPDNSCPVVSTLRFPALFPAGTPLNARLRSTLASARTRRGAALNPTRIPTLLSSSYDANDIASDSDSDADSDSDSDCESDSGFSFTSASSATSVSTASFAPFLCTPVRATPAAKPDVKRYTYHGGVTQVVSGGVMLGAPVQPRAAAFSRGRPSSITQSAVRKTAISMADSWRRSA
ncbi:hypothetical protein B0H19DRAFT_1378843 [Mycena capillaripes]|nr:hypothetical protein B0H19DRAFT_1378843 [Mycena capillaripes]